MENPKNQTIIKQWGLQRSGTNLTKWLLEKNFQNLEVYTNQMSWKHSVPSNTKQFEKYARPYLREPDFHIVTLRDPYSWLYSFIKYCDRNPPTLPSNFPLYQSQPNNTQEIMSLWNKYVGEYLDFIAHNDRVLVVTYRQLILNPEKVLSRIQNKFALSKSKSITNFIFPKEGVDPHTKGEKLDLNFTVARKYLAKITLEEKRIINNTVSLRVKFFFLLKKFCFIFN